MKVMIIFTTVRDGNKDNFGEEFRNKWRLSESPWDSDQKINDSDRRLIVYDGKTIWEKKNVNDNEKYFNTLFKICNEIINETGANTEFLVLIHTQLEDYVQKMKEGLVNLEKIHVCIYSSTGTGIKRYEKLIKPLAKSTSEVKEDNFNLSDWEVCFDNIWNDRSKDIVKKKVNETLHLFLPLDIDMQALEFLAKKEKGVKVKEPNEYLEEMYADNIDYLQKFKELQAKAKELSEIEGIDKERLRKLADISNENVCQFFDKLGDKKDDPDEFLGHSWGIDGVKSFPNWYRALATCLRGKEVYEKVRKYLYENTGHLTTPGTPRFDIKTKTWKVPVLCKAERGILI